MFLDCIQPRNDTISHNVCNTEHSRCNYQGHNAFATDLSDGNELDRVSMLTHVKQYKRV